MESHVHNLRKLDLKLVCNLSLLCMCMYFFSGNNDCFFFLADFGFARFLQDGVMAATLCGSPMYMVCVTFH